jgi:hypothetical protein
MRKVIDVSGLDSDELKAFLADPDNSAVVTDIMAIEGLKHKGRPGDELAFFRRMLEPIADHTNRVAVLNPTRELHKTRPHAGLSSEDLIDRQATMDFRLFVTAVMGGVQSEITRHIEANQIRGRGFFDQLIARGGPELMRVGLTEQANKWPENVVKDLRAGRPIGKEFYDYACALILTSTAYSIEHHFPGQADIAPNREDVFYWLPFRYGAAMHALAAYWIKHGGHTTAKPDKLRNDAVDMFCVAYGTFFDGIITDDAKLKEIYLLTADILKNSFGISPA